MGREKAEAYGTNFVLFSTWPWTNGTDTEDLSTVYYYWIELHKENPWKYGTFGR
jgi:hypothetical protein